MKTRVVAFAFALLAGITGCKTENHASLQLVGICSPPEDAKACGTTGECEGFLAVRPYVETLLAIPPAPADPVFNQLLVFFQVDNQLPNNADPSAGRVNTNDAIIESFELSFEVQDTFRDLARALPFTVSVRDVSIPAADTVRATGSSTPIVPLIPQAVVEQISNGMALDYDGLATVVVTLRMKGHLEDGTDFDTAEHTYPVDFIDGLFTPFACPPGESLVAVCPNVGQTASITCEGA
jgi:hypothetical protein